MALAGIKENLKGRGDIRVEQIAVGKVMGVALSGPAFTVTQISPPDPSVRGQTIPKDGYAQWLFDVLPREAGEKNLLLQIAVELISDQNDRSTWEPVFEREITVEVNRWWMTKRFATSDTGKWIIGGVATAIVGIVTYFAKRWIES